MRVLVVEDNRRLAALLGRGLREEGFGVHVAYDGLEALRAAAQDGPFDVVVLDWMLPGLEGVGVLKRLRDAGDPVPVLMLTARDGVGDRVVGLDAGADDYLVKPFAFEELLARLRALVRRTKGAAANLLCIADLQVDTVARRVRRGGQTIELSAREYSVLECLAQNRGRIVGRERLFEHVYDHATEVGSNVIDVYVAHLRKKVDRGHEVKLIHTRRGQGYILDAPETTS